ncbi:MAG: glycosyltransferase family 2 protein [Patescibacteria group bacterium]
MNNTPKISIHMCTFNRAHFIAQAIDSVLKQSYQAWELLILDDCSTDNTRDIVQPYLRDSRIIYIKNDHNLGITPNRNKALSLSTGTYIAVLDSDDFWIDAGKLADQVKFLETHKDHVLVGTNMIIVSEQGKMLKKTHYPTSDYVIKMFLLLKNFFCHSSIMYRKQEIMIAGGYNQLLAIWEDYDLWLKLGRKYKLANLPSHATAYRKHNNQSNSDKVHVGLLTQSHIINSYKDTYPGFEIATLVHKFRSRKSHGK